MDDSILHLAGCLIGAYRFALVLMSCFFTLFSDISEGPDACVYSCPLSVWCLFSSLVVLCDSAVRTSSGHSDVRNAMDAVETYKNITDAINAAEQAANEAKDAADKALNVSLFHRLDFYITEHTLLFM